MSLAHAVAAMGPGALTEDALRLHVFPLFSNTLAAPGIYLANHSLGRPLNQTEDDLREGFHLWQTRLGDAWEPWLEEELAHRSRLAQLIGASRSDCVIPKTSAGQGLRTALNALPGVPHIVSTTGEFDSIDVILKQYAAAGRISLQLINCHAADGNIDLSELMQKVRDGVDLVVISQVMFMTGRVVPNLDLLAEE
jgi:kynureninase